MTEWKLFPGGVPYVSTAEFHRDRPRAPHLDQPHHWPRLHVAGQYLREAGGPFETLSDLGCGDGGLLALVQDAYYKAWGYDFSPANAAGWAERGVTAELADVFNNPGREWDIALGSVVAMTEVLEHLADPHAILKWLYDDGSVGALVCSSPVNENADMHDECHAWAWDYEGYEAMIKAAGWTIVMHEVIGPFQVVWAAS